jgi:hypothetical protein
MPHRNQDGGFFAGFMRAFSGLLLIAAPGFGNAATPCAIQAQPWLSLTITASAAVAASDRTLSVRVHDDGCTEIHRPAFYRLAGDYRLQLTSDELSALRAKGFAKQLRDFDAAKISAALAGSRASVAKSGGAALERSTVVDADRFALEAIEAGKRSAAAWSGLHDYAEIYPEMTDLVALSDNVKAIQRLLEREDAVRVQGAAR